MNDVSTLLYQFLKAKFGDLDWENGSVLRELVAEPIVALAEQAVQAINAAYNTLNISALLAAPEDNADAINSLFDYLGLAATTPRTSIGSVRVLVASPESFIVPVGASFSFRDAILTVTSQYTVSLNASSSAGGLKLNQIGYNAYEVIIPVEGSLVGESISAGTELTWNIANPNIYSATVYSTIIGSGSTYTATQKINQIRQYLYPASLTCAEGYLKTINSYSEGLAVDCLLDSKYPTNGVNLFVKTVNPPEVWRIPATGELVDGKYQASISAIGISRVLSVIGGQLESALWDDRGILIIWSGSSGEVEIEVTGLKDLITAQEAIDNYTANTGVRVNVKPPRLLTLSMYLPIVASTLGVEATSQVVAAINNSLLNAAGLGDHTTTPILRAAGISLQGAGTYTLEDEFSGYKQTTLATINTTPFASATTPFAIYTFSNKISTTQNG